MFVGMGIYFTIQAGIYVAEMITFPGFLGKDGTAKNYIEWYDGIYQTLFTVRGYSWLI